MDDLGERPQPADLGVQLGREPPQRGLPRRRSRPGAGCGHEQQVELGQRALGGEITVGQRPQRQGVPVERDLHGAGPLRGVADCAQRRHLGGLLLQQRELGLGSASGLLARSGLLGVGERPLGVATGPLPPRGVGSRRGASLLGALGQRGGPAGGSLQVLRQRGPGLLRKPCSSQA